MLWNRQRRRDRSPGVEIAGEFLGYPDLCTSFLFTGGIGKGKSFATEVLLAQLVRLGCPMLACCVKPDEAQRYLRLCRDPAARERLRPIRPGSPWKINLLDYLCTMPGGGARVAIQFLSRLQDVLQRAESGQQTQETYWRQLFESGLLAAIELVLIADGKVGIDKVYRVLATSPANPEQAASIDYYAKTYCGRLLARASEIAEDPSRPHGLKRRIERATDVLVTELASIGYKARGAVLSMNNGLLARFLDDPFHDLLCTETTWTPEAAERGGFIDVVDFPVLIHGTAGRMLQLAFAMLVQGHCLRRDPAAVDRPYCLVRDEASFVLHPDWDASVQVVARSQKLAAVDVIQDLDILLAALGGGEKARHEAFAFASNHMNKLLFGNANQETNEYFSRFFGDRKEMNVGGSNAPGGRADFFDEVLGSTGQFQWNESGYEPHIRPGRFAGLKTGEAVMYLGGRPLGRSGEPYRFVDFWTGGPR